jgi:hypothetical protein
LIDAIDIYLFIDLSANLINPPNPLKKGAKIRKYPFLRGF